MSSARQRWVWVGLAAVLLAGGLGVALWPDSETPAPVVVRPPPPVATSAEDAGEGDEGDVAVPDVGRVFRVRTLDDLPADVQPGDEVIIEDMEAELARQREFGQQRRKFLEPVIDETADPIPEGTKTGALRVLVKRKTGAPVAGQAVTLIRQPDGHDSPRSTFRPGDRRTDAQGLATWPQLPVGRWGAFVSEHGGISRGQNALIKGGDEATLEFEVEEQFAASGKVVDSNGEPVSGAFVQAVLGAGEAGPDDLERKKVETDEAGRFEIEKLRAFAYDFVATHPERGAGRARGKVPGEGVVVKLSSGAIIFGSLVDGLGKAHDYQAVLYAEGGGRAYEQLEKLNLKGGAPFEFKGPVSEGKYDIEIHFEGRKLEKHFEVKANERRVEVRFELPKGQAIGGRVVDPSGKPQPTVKLSLRPDDKDEDGRRTESDAEGRFLFEGLVGKSYGLSALSAGHVFKETRVEAGNQSVVLTLYPKASLRGRLLDASGVPVPKFKVAFKQVSSPTGAFEVDLTEDDPWLHFSTETSAGFVQQFKAKLGEGADLGDVRMPPGPELVVTVVDETTGAPMPNLYLGLHILRGNTWYAVGGGKGPTDAQGKTRLPAPLGADLHVLCAWFACFGEVAAPQGSTQLTFRAKPFPKRQ